MTRKQTIISIIATVCSVALVVAGVHYYFDKQEQEAERKRIMAESVEWELTFGNAELAKTKEGILSSRLEAQTDFPHYGTAFYDDKGNILRILNGPGGGWRFSGTPIGGQSDIQPLPSSFELTYYSWLNNSFYRMEQQPLPKAELYKLMTTPIMSGGRKLKPVTLDYLSLKAAPDGWLILFVGGEGGILKEVGSWQAKEIVPDLNKLDKERAYGMYDMIDFQKGYHAGYLAEKKRQFPDFFRKYMSGGIHKLSADWYKKMQTKYPWVLQVELADAGNWHWNGEYEVEFANTERWPVLGQESIAADKLIQKAIPYYFKFWIQEKQSGRRWAIVVRLFQDDTWEQNWFYDIFYDDPKLNALYRQFQYIFPNRTRLDNQRTVSPTDFAVLKVKLDDNFELDKATLEKGGKSVQLGTKAHVVQRYEVKSGEYW